MRRARCGCAVALVLLVGLVVGLLIAADRVMLGITERASNAALDREGARRAQVSYSGFPFLTQLVRGRFERVDVRAASFTHQGVTVEGVRARLRGVRPKGSEGRTIPRSVVADSLTGSFGVSYATVETQGRLPRGSLSTVGERVRIRGVVDVLGYDVTVTGAGEVRVDGSELVITPKDVALPGALGDRLATAAAREIEVRYPLVGLPPGLRITRVRPTPTGLDVSVEGTDVVLEE